RRCRGARLQRHDPPRHRSGPRRDRSAAGHGRRRRANHHPSRIDRSRGAAPAAGGRHHRRGLSRSPERVADGAVRPRAAPRRARAGAGAPADHARIGGPMSPLARMPGWPSRRPVRSWLPPIVLSGVAVAIGCNRAPQADAYGNVEATEVVVSAEAAGRLTTYTVVEGQTLSADAVVATIDTTQLNIEREQAAAQRSATASRVNEVRQQIAVLEAQRAAAT